MSRFENCHDYFTPRSDRRTWFDQPTGQYARVALGGLESGRSGVAPIQAFPVAYLPTSFAAEAREFTGSIDDFGPLDRRKEKGDSQRP